MATLIATDYNSMLNMGQSVVLHYGTQGECEERAEYFKAHTELGYGNLRVV